MAVTELTELDRAMLKERRDEFWRWVARIAVGGFIALVMWSLLAYVVLKLWVDANFG